MTYLSQFESVFTDLSNQYKAEKATFWASRTRALWAALHPVLTKMGPMVDEQTALGQLERAMEMKFLEQLYLDGHKSSIENDGAWPQHLLALKGYVEDIPGYQVEVLIAQGLQFSASSEQSVPGIEKHQMLVDAVLSSLKTPA